MIKASVYNLSSQYSLLLTLPIYVDSFACTVKVCTVVYGEISCHKCINEIIETCGLDEDSENALSARFALTGSSTLSLFYIIFNHNKSLMTINFTSLYLSMNISVKNSLLESFSLSFTRYTN